MTNEDLKLEIAKIKERNLKVDQNKAWETSNFRKLAIAVITYIFMCSFFYTIKVDKPFINSIVPTFGYLLSTLSLGVLKKYWIGKYKN